MKKSALLRILLLSSSLFSLSACRDKVQIATAAIDELVYVVDTASPDWKVWYRTVYYDEDIA